MAQGLVRTLFIGLIALVGYAVTGDWLWPLVIGAFIQFAILVVFPRHLARMHPRLAWLEWFDRDDPFRPLLGLTRRLRGNGDR